MNTYGRKMYEYVFITQSSGQIMANGHWNLIYPSTFKEILDLLAEKRRNELVIPLQYH
jgi:hypothetical protein